jgi:aminoglycoside phosphotransferase (APT) family kinase protein
MSDAVKTTIARPIGFDPDRLDRFLRAHIAGLEGPMRLERIHGGQSNPTFFVDYANRRLVVRKQPGGPVLQSAHAIDREFRIMSALATTVVPVPRVLQFHAENDVVGTPFYVMERLEGRVFTDGSMPTVAFDQRRPLLLSTARTLASLHRLDYTSIGLQDYGRPGNYFERQIARWTRQWRDSKTRELPDVERLIEWLPKNVPCSELTSISHGDYRVYNLMFHPVEARVVGVLDWELSTLGHPLADLAFSALSWRLPPTYPAGLLGLDLKALGLPSEQEYLETYYAIAPEVGRVTPFHTAFALFRLAVIFEGIASRAQLGIASADNAAEVGRLSSDLARRGVEALDG